MTGDFFPCPSCPADFTMPAALDEHRLTCRPREAAPPRAKRESTGDKLEALAKRSAKAQGLTLNQTSARAVVTGRQNGRPVSRVVAAGELDFTGHLDGRYFTFDAKSTKRLNFGLPLIKPHQATICKNRQSEGAIAFFLVELSTFPGGPRYFAVPWPALAPYWAGQQWTAPSLSLKQLEQSAVEVRQRGKLLDLAGAIWKLQEVPR